MMSTGKNKCLNNFKKFSPDYISDLISYGDLNNITRICFVCLVSGVFTFIFNRNFIFDKLKIFWVIIQENIIYFRNEV